MSCLSFYLQCLEHGWHINICPMSDQTIVLRSIWFITRAQLVFISINPLPPTVPAFEKGSSDLSPPQWKKPVHSLDVIQKPSCSTVCPGRLWEGRGVWAGLYVSTANGGRKRYFWGETEPKTQRWTSPWDHLLAKRLGNSVGSQQFLKAKVIILSPSAPPD